MEDLLIAVLLTENTTQAKKYTIQVTYIEVTPSGFDSSTTHKTSFQLEEQVTIYL